MTDTKKIKPFCIKIEDNIRVKFREACKLNGRTLEWTLPKLLKYYIKNKDHMDDLLKEE